MPFSMRRNLRALLVVLVSLCVAVTSAGGQGGMANSRKVTAAEQAFVDRLAAEFAKILPPVPAGWAEVERKIYESGGMTSDWDAPISADYEVQFVSADLETRQKLVEKRQEEMAEKNKDAFEASAARNEKLMAEFSVKLEAAMKKQDQALIDRLQADFKKQMDAGAMAAPSAPAPELSDTYARIRISINPYNAPVMEEQRMPTPPGFTWVGRRAPNENQSDREGVTRYLIGNWAVNTVGSGHTLKFTPNKGTVVYGIAVEIEARADRADALFRAMSIVRLKALLQQ